MNKMTEEKESPKKRPVTKVMSDEQYEMLTSTFSKYRGGGCMFCGSKEFFIPNETLSIHVTQENGFSFPPPAMPVFFVQCQNCGFTYMFSPQFIKLRDGEK